MKKITLLAAIVGLFSYSVVSSAQIIFQDNFDNADYTVAEIVAATSTKPALVFGPAGKEWKFYYTPSYDPRASGSVEQLGGRLIIKDNLLGGLRVGDGVFLKSTYTPEFNFFGDPAATTPTKRVFSIRGIKFGTDPNTPKHFHNIAFYLASNSAYPTFGSSFVVTLGGLNHFSVLARQALSNKEIALFPSTTIPVQPDSIDVVLDATNYRVVFYFAGGGLYFEGQHGLDRTQWERIDAGVTPPGGLPGNFTPGIIGYTTSLYDSRLSEVSVDSFTVTDGN